jgi:hypothetical protein
MFVLWLEYNEIINKISFSFKLAGIDVYFITLKYMEVYKNEK